MTGGNSLRTVRSFISCVRRQGLSHLLWRPAPPHRYKSV